MRSERVERVERVMVALVAAMGCGCSVVIESDDATFARDASRCAQVGEPQYVKPAELHASAWFGAVLAADEVEDVIVAVAPTEADRPDQAETFPLTEPDPMEYLPDGVRGTGSLHFLERDPGGHWAERSRRRVLGPEKITPVLPTFLLPDLYGSVILPAFSASVRAGIAAIGLPTDERAVLGDGTVRLFERGPAGWDERVERLEVPDLGVLSGFGYAVALGSDLLAVGAPGASGSVEGELAPVGAVVIYEREANEFVRHALVPSARPQNVALFGATLALSDDWLIVAAPLEDDKDEPELTVTGKKIQEHGVVYAYRRRGKELELPVTVLPPGFPRLHYGASLALLGNTLVVGAPTAPGCNDYSQDFFGAVHVFENVGGSWMHRRCLQGSKPTRFFGWKVGLTSDTLAVAEPWRQGGDPAASTVASGGVHVFPLSSLDESKACLLTAPNADRDDNFGSALVVTSRFVGVGAPFEDGAQLGPDIRLGDNQKLNAGALYLHELGAPR